MSVIAARRACLKLLRRAPRGVVPEWIGTLGEESDHASSKAVSGPSRTPFGGVPESRTRTTGGSALPVRARRESAP